MHTDSDTITVADPVFWKGGGRQEEMGKSFLWWTMSLRRSCDDAWPEGARLLGGSGGMPPQKIFTLSMQNGALWRHFYPYFTLK